MSVAAAEVLKKVKRIEINTRKLVNNVFSGEYHTAFKGQGMTFADFREYVPGDDVRSISWALTARAGKPFIKTFEEERELTMILAVDVSGSTDFGSGDQFKGETMTLVAATLAFSAIKNNDQVGLLLFSDEVEHFVPPKKGRGHVHRILRDLLFFKPKRSGTRISTAASYLQGILKKRASIFVLSDFIDKNFDSSLRLLARKHDVVSVIVQDRAELVLPDMGLVEVQDAETGEVIVVDTSDPYFRSEFHKEVQKQKDERDRTIRRAQISRVEITSQEDFVKPLVAFFKQRKSR